MMTLLTQLFTAMIQVLLFATLPFLWWLVFDRKKQNFFSWIGLKPINSADKKPVFSSAATACVLFTGLSLLLLYLLKGVETATSEFAGLGMSGLPSALIYAFVKTGLSEEIVFRGFVLKRLASKIGFAVANIIQSFLFGLLHGIMFFNFVNPIIAVAIIIFTGSVAWFMGYINEKKADGSILPSWIIHGLSNTLSSVISLFCIM